MGLNPLNNRPITREELIELIKNNEDVRFVNTSEIRDFSNLLEGFNTFNQDISRWDTESFDFKIVSTWFESFKSLNEMKDLLDKFSLNYIYEKDKYITFFLEMKLN